MLTIRAPGHLQSVPMPLPRRRRASLWRHRIDILAPRNRRIHSVFNLWKRAFKHSGSLRGGVLQNQPATCRVAEAHMTPLTGLPGSAFSRAPR